MAETVHRSVTTQADVEYARREARHLARSLGFGPAAAEAVALSVSELATNLVRYAKDGEILVVPWETPLRRGIRIESRDRGPGLANLARALEDGYSTGGGLGSGLPGVRRLMDDFQIESDPAGTRIVAVKWLPHA